MYWLGFEGGHDATAVSSLSPVWRFAEGFTGGDFETYFLLANTTGASVSATLSFFRDSGAVVTKTVSIAPNSRRTVRVRDYPELAGRGLRHDASPRARRSSPNGRCTGAASSRGTRPPA